MTYKYQVREEEGWQKTEVWLKMALKTYEQLKLVQEADGQGQK